MGTEQAELGRLRSLAEQLGRILPRQTKRPFVLEITGTPKAGKTTLIKTVEDFLTTCGWKVHVLQERASVCPLAMKGHFHFNTWTFGTMLAGLLDAIDRKYDLVIVDRGLFDALIWLRIQLDTHQASSSEADAFSRFAVLPRFRELIDAVVLMEVDPAVAMQRENQWRLAARSGSVMTPGMLQRFNQAMSAQASELADEFRFVRLRNDHDQSSGSIALLSELLPRARTWSDPMVAVIRRSTADDLVPASCEWTDELFDKLATHVEFRERSTVEDSEEFVQLLACGVQTHQQKVFVVSRLPRHDDDPSPRASTARVWNGCHIVRHESGVLDLDDVGAQLVERLARDLHLRELEVVPRPRGFVWSPDNKEDHHLGMVFQVSVADQTVAEFLDERQFKTNGRGFRLKTSFLNAQDALKHRPDGVRLESWSHTVLSRGWHR